MKNKRLRKMMRSIVMGVMIASFCFSTIIVNVAAAEELPVCTEMTEDANWSDYTESSNSMEKLEGTEVTGESEVAKTPESIEEAESTEKLEGTEVTGESEVAETPESIEEPESTEKLEGTEATGESEATEISENSEKPTSISKSKSIKETTETTTQNKVVDAAGVELSEEETQKINELLESIEKTEGVVVYANELDRTNHIEGNIAVNTVTAGNVNVVLGDVPENEKSDTSYVGESNGGIQISDGANIIVGDSVSVSKPNENQTVINGGYSNNINVIKLSEDETEEMEKTINNNLEEISAAGEAAKSQIDEAFYADSTDAFESVNNMLKNDVLTEGDIVSINVDYKSILQNEGAFGNLINANKGTTVVVNIIMTEENVTEITILKAFSANVEVDTRFNEYSPYIVWNFGSYNGNININEEMVGIIVAPCASVYQAAGNLNGQIIAQVAGNNGELHQVTQQTEEPKEPEPEPEPTPEPEPEPEPTPEPEPEPEPTPEPEPEPEPTPEPEPEPEPTPEPKPEPTVKPEPKPEPTVKPEPETNPTPKSELKPENEVPTPQTGDDSNVIVYFMTAVVSAIMLVTLARKKRKN